MNYVSDYDTALDLAPFLVKALEKCHCADGHYTMDVLCHIPNIGFVLEQVVMNDNREIKENFVVTCPKPITTMYPTETITTT